MSWYQLYVKAPPGNGYDNSEAVQRIDDHLSAAGWAFFRRPVPEGVIIQEDDGTFEVRVFDEANLGFVKSILNNHYGLEIIREVENE